MCTLKHVRLVTQTPEQAQISNFQVKLDFTTAVIDRLLLADRQSGWKVIGTGTSTTDVSDIDTSGIDISSYL